MAVEAELSPDEKQLTIRVVGRFDFGKHTAFRNAYEHRPVLPERVVVDLRGTTYLDSSALGMLLLLRDHAGGDQADVRLVNVSQDVRTILAISNFTQLFEVN